MSNPALVAIGYNRPDSMQRLLNSLKHAHYNGLKVVLIISLDNCGSDDVFKIAQSFEWPYGEKKIILHPERLGLRKHVISCGNLTTEYDTVVLLEDDLIVSPYFYQYVLQTFNKYKNEDRIAGVSLYTHLWNQDINRPFLPQYNGFDAYFMQFAQSWGQAWNHRMWQQFYTWYKKNDNEFFDAPDLPYNVTQWPNSSWLKYFIRYIVITDKYFIYPYTSLTSNFTESGTHNSLSSTGYQVPLLWLPKNEYNLPDFTVESLRYDVFFENQNLAKKLEIPDDQLCVDLYQSKNNHDKKRFWLTSKKCNYKVLHGYALKLRPHELNIEANIEGNEIFLYDTSVETVPIITNDKIDYKALRIKYDIRSTSRQEISYILIYEIKQAIKRKLAKYLTRK